ncbi:MAG TPA: DUF6424 family protein [Syntrophales bacterium]|nr:DUF6424 family protein [Syntrophales bacterium]
MAKSKAHARRKSPQCGSSAPAAGSTAKVVDVTKLHTIRAGETITANVEGHAARADSQEFKNSRTTLHKILKETGTFYYGSEPVQAHHGASLWVHDGKTWRMYQNLAGIEWSGQFCADAKKVDILRQNAKALVDRFPDTIPNLKRLGYNDAEKILGTPITNAEGISLFVDSLFNACVPLPQPVHTGAISANNTRAAGKHTYPTPNDDTVFFCRDDFNPFVYDPKTKTTYHVAPMANQGPDAKRVRVINVSAPTADNPVLKKRQSAHKTGKALVLDENDPISKKAFAGGAGQKRIKCANSAV